MRRVFASLLAAAMAVSVHGFATDAATTVDITDVSIQNGLISVEAVNHGDPTRLTLTVTKTSPAGLGAREKLAAVLQEDAEKEEIVTYRFIIPDTNEFDIPGTGTYQIRVTNTQKEGDSQELKYADSVTVTNFVNDLKSADSSVSDDSLAWDTLDDVVKNSVYEGVYFTIGMDYDLYVSKSETIQKDTLNVLHKDGVQTLTKETLPKAFLSAFGVASFNNGDKAEGVQILAPTYDGNAVDATMTESAIRIMDAKYDSGLAFATGFNQAYGIATINAANINSMADVLTKFQTATGLCSTNISNILGLLETYRYKAFEYMLTSIYTNPVKNETELDALLLAAYNYALSNPQGGGSTGGGGGGGGGSFGNSTAPTQGSVSSPVGSGINDQKYQPTNIGFTDLMSNHWAAESILWLKENGIVNGTETGAFEPERTVTREEFIKMVILAMGFELADKAIDFTDAESGAWYQNYIATAVENGIVNGVGENRFGIGQNITRQDMTVMIERAMQVSGKTLTQGNVYNGFADDSRIADYAKGAVKALYESGIIHGKDNNCFEPAGHATRAEAAKIIYEACKGGK
ncbi:MAG: S-layer homology domain-containing protein [Clostridia bacterium]|nr:S-layer homology domain-containing protein [Clostridia bacterium]